MVAQCSLRTDTDLSAAQDVMNVALERRFRSLEDQMRRQVHGGDVDCSDLCSGTGERNYV